MTEPNYVYVRGQGWVPSLAFRERWGHFEVTIEERMPLPDERWKYSYRPLDEFIVWFKSNYNWTFNFQTSSRDLGDIILLPGPAEDADYEAGSYVYTIKIERIVNNERPRRT